MLGTYADAQALSWPVALPRRRRRQVALGPTGRQAVRHGIRGAIQATCLSCAVLAASGLLGASRGPVVLSEPNQPSAVHVGVAVGASLSAAMPPKLTTR